MILPIATDTIGASLIAISDKSYNKCKPPLAMPRGKLQLATR